RQSSHGVKLIPPNVTRKLITEGVAAGLSLKRMVNLTTRCPQRGRNNPAILTAAPFRVVPQPEAHGRRKFNDRLSMNQLPRRALSRYGLTFHGNILSVNCQCRMLTRVRRTHSTSPVENSLITNLSFVG
ncbi:hypothetical protein MLT40_26335, partial [Escherichia coli]|nr:hypothetical protein [Escherichia coli]MCN3392790.1 hypothetical protein [Escherichia coli]MCN6202362.1 hypothetical protein [Escherichia coli]MCY6779414.1 hypothetical protein [Escherichia coli]MCY6784177.1 hypothetical protein [Escherichia coli]